KKLEDRQGALVTNYKEGKKACAKIDAAIATQERELKTLRADMLLQRGKLDEFINERERYFADLLSGAPDYSFEAILEVFDEVPDSMKEAALESTQERVEDIQGALTQEQSRSTDAFMAGIVAKVNEAK
ncbi:hypothetical protein D5E86_26300, partial [Vibrio parahaemolyticus]